MTSSTQCRLDEQSILARIVALEAEQSGSFRRSSRIMHKKLVAIRDDAPDGIRAKLLELTPNCAEVFETLWCETPLSLARPDWPYDPEPLSF